MASPKNFGFIHITSHGLVSVESLCSWVIVKVGHSVVQGQGNVGQAASACAKLPTAIALSVYDLMLTKVTLPTKSQSQRRTAIPYAIQNQLATPAKDMHWSWRAKGQQLQVVGLAHSQITSINTTLQALHFSPKWLIADGLHLGGHNAHWQLMVLPNSWLLQQGQHRACCIASEAPLPWLQKAYDEAHNSAAGEPLNISVTGPVSDVLNQWFISASIEPQTHKNTEEFNSAVILAQDFDATTCINLLPKNPRTIWAPSINWKLWRLPYTLTVLLALLGLSHLWLNNIATTQQIEKTYKQGVSIFQDTLPNERLVDPLSQLQGQVLAAQEPKHTAIFFPMLHAFQQFNSSLKQGTEASKISLIEFSDAQLKITLTATLKILNEWPKQGVLAGEFSYTAEPIKQLKSNDESILITLSTLEAR
jgi:type II secretion system protein L